MTNPDETRASEEARQASDASEGQKKPAAQPGVIDSSDTGPGQGDAAMARGGETSPADSSLLGQSSDGRPAAAPKGKAAESGLRSSPFPDTRPAEPKPAPSNPAPSGPAPRVTVQKTGFWPVVMGGVVAAGLGAGATIWALPHLPAGWLPQQPQAAIDADAITAEAVAAAQQTAQQLVDDFADSLTIPAPAEAEGAVADTQDIDELRQELADLRARVDDQSQRLDNLNTGAEADPEAVERIQSLAAQASQLEQRIAEAAEAANRQISAAQAEAERLQAAAQESTRRAEAVAAIGNLQAALDRGVSAEQAQQALEQAGVAAPEALSRDVPSLLALQADFDEAARAALRAALREDSASGGNRLANFLRAQTGARSVEPREGDDPDAILSRADAAVEAGDIDGALAQLEGLPEAARSAPAMAGWIADASAYRDAQAALSDLSATTN